jgi:phosphatidylinositol-4,5-bisphosphate 3-kinase
MDLQMTLYRCVATGWQTGMLEAVLNADTTAKIQKEAGGVTGAFNKKSITNWLEKHNSEGKYLTPVKQAFFY